MAQLRTNTARQAQPACQDCPRQPLAVMETLAVMEALARRCTGLPLWRNLADGEISRVRAALAGGAAPDRPAPRNIVI